MDEIEANRQTTKEKVKRYISTNLSNKILENDFVYFDMSYSFGMSLLWLYTRWLEPSKDSRPANASKNVSYPKINKTWFDSIIKLISEWNGEERLDAEKHVEIKRLISIITFLQYFQRGGDYSQIRQNGDVLTDQVVTDINEIKRKNLTKEYSIASLFSLDQLKQILENKDIIQDGKLIIITSYKNNTALFKDSDHFYYFNPNGRSEEM